MTVNSAIFYQTIHLAGTLGTKNTGFFRVFLLKDAKDDKDAHILYRTVCTHI